MSDRTATEIMLKNGATIGEVLDAKDKEIAALKRENEELRKEPRLVSHGVDMESCTLTLDGGYIFYRRYDEDKFHLERENEELRAGMEKSNAQASHFEREWYLRGDELEALKAYQESVEPFAWIRDDGRGFWEFTDCDDPIGFAVYTIPTAAIESFKRRAVEAVKEAGYDFAHEVIAALPLIEELEDE